MRRCAVRLARSLTLCRLDLRFGGWGQGEFCRAVDSCCTEEIAICHPSVADTDEEETAPASLRRASREANQHTRSVWAISRGSSHSMLQANAGRNRRNRQLIALNRTQKQPCPYNTFMHYWQKLHKTSWSFKPLVGMRWQRNVPLTHSSASDLGRLALGTPSLLLPLSRRSFLPLLSSGVLLALRDALRAARASGVSALSFFLALLLPAGVSASCTAWGLLAAGEKVKNRERKIQDKSSIGPCVTKCQTQQSQLEVASTYAAVSKSMISSFLHHLTMCSPCYFAAQRTVLTSGAKRHEAVVELRRLAYCALGLCGGDNGRNVHCLHKHHLPCQCHAESQLVLAPRWQNGHDAVPQRPALVRRLTRREENVRVG